MPWVSRSNPTYLRVYARQRPGGVAWDAVPLTVSGLNKAAGNPPLQGYYKLQAACSREFLDILDNPDKKSASQ